MLKTKPSACTGYDGFFYWLGAASHPFSWNVQRAGALSFRFDHILLPDSNVNEPVSHGFIQFKIRPEADVPLNTVVENTAPIYFDFNAPVVTNTSWHRLGRDFYTVVSVFDRPGTLPVTVRPNPFGQRAQLVLPENATGQYQFQLYDAGGRILRDQAFSGPRLEFDAAGLYCRASAVHTHGAIGQTTLSRQANMGSAQLYTADARRYRPGVYCQKDGAMVAQGKMECRL